MNLYLCVYTRLYDGCSLDAVVQAQTPEQAVDKWREHWEDEEWIDENYFDGPFREGHTDDKDTVRIFQIEPKPGVIGTLGWFSETDAGTMRLCGYVNS